MQLVILNNRVIATHTDDQDLTGLYPGCDIILYDGDFKMSVDGATNLDPRTESEKLLVYKSKRRLEYPNIVDQLDLLYWDMVNGTKNWEELITSIKVKYPKP